MQAGQPDPGPGRGLPRDDADQVAGGRTRASPRDAGAAGCCSPARGSPAASPRVRSSDSPSWPATSGIGWRRIAPPRPAGTCDGSPVARGLGAGQRQRRAPPRPTTRRLERLVRSSFRHAARYYLEVARTPSLPPTSSRSGSSSIRRSSSPRPSSRARRCCSSVSTSGRSSSPCVFLAFRVGTTVTPMETIDDPALQAYFERTRGVAGIRLVGLREARRELLGALRDGIPVGLVGDRDLTGRGTPIPLFGAPAVTAARPGDARRRERRAASMSMTVRRAGAADFAASSSRRRARRWHAPRTRDDDDDAPGGRLRRAHRRRPGPVVGGLLPDLARPRGGRRAGAATTGATDANGAAACAVARAPRPRRPPHPHRRERRHCGRRGDPRSRRAADATSTSSRSPTTSGSTQRSPHDRSRATSACASTSWSAKRSRLSAATSLRSSSSVRSRRSLAARRRSLDVHDAGGLAIPAHPLVPYPLCAQGWMLRRLLDDPDPRRPPGRPSRRSTRRRSGKPWHRRVVRFADRHGLAHVGNSDAHALEAIGDRLDDLPGP